MFMLKPLAILLSLSNPAQHVAITCYLVGQHVHIGPNGARNICEYQCGAERASMSVQSTELCPMTAEY